MIIFPEFTGLTIWPDLPGIARRRENPVAIRDDEAALLANDVFSLLEDLNVHEYVRAQVE